MVAMRLQFGITQFIIKISRYFLRDQISAYVCKTLLIDLRNTSTYGVGKCEKGEYMTPMLRTNLCENIEYRM